MWIQTNPSEKAAASQQQSLTTAKLIFKILLLFLSQLCIPSSYLPSSSGIFVFIYLFLEIASRYTDTDTMPLMSKSFFFSIIFDL